MKIAVGINDILKKTKHGNTHYNLHQRTDTALLGLLNLRQAIYRACPKAVVTFITIPPAHLVKYKETNGIYEEINLDENQELHLHEVMQLNRRLEEENKGQGFNFKPCKTHSLLAPWNNKQFQKKEAQWRLQDKTEN